MVHREALSLSFIDNFWRLAWIFAAVIHSPCCSGGGGAKAEAPAAVDRPAAIVEA